MRASSPWRLLTGVFLVFLLSGDHALAVRSNAVSGSLSHQLASTDFFGAALIHDIQEETENQGLHSFRRHSKVIDDPQGDDVSVFTGDEGDILASEADRLAFDDYIDALIASRVSESMAAHWDWLDKRVAEAHAGLRAAKRKAVTFGRDVSDSVKDTYEDASAQAGMVADAVSERIDSIKEFANLGENLNKVLGFAKRIFVGSSDSVGLFDVVKALIFGILNGCFLGVMESLRKAWDEVMGDKTAMDLLSDLHSAMSDAIVNGMVLITGIFDKDIRGSKSRLSWIEEKIEATVKAIGNALAKLWAFMTAESTGKFFAPIFLLMTLGFVFTCVMIVLPGIGWIVKLAAVVMTGVLSGQYLMRRTIPRFMGAYRNCASTKLAECDTVAMVESVGEVIGFVIAMLLIVRPSDIAKIRNIKVLFNKNWLAKKLHLTFRPSMSKSIGILREMVTLSFHKGRAAGSSLVTMKELVRNSKPLTELVATSKHATKIAYRVSRLAQEKQLKGARKEEARRLNNIEKSTLDESQINAKLIDSDAETELVKK